MIHRLIALRFAKHAASVTLYTTLFMSLAIHEALRTPTLTCIPWYIWLGLWAIFYREYRNTLEKIEGSGHGI